MHDRLWKYLTGRRQTMGTVAVVGVAALGLTGGAATEAAAQIRTAYVLTDSASLLTIDTANPGTALASVPVVGITAGETLAGMDVRPMNGMLYGLGVNAGADTMSLYLISPRSGFAAIVARAASAAPATCRIRRIRITDSTSIRTPIACA